MSVRTKRKSPLVYRSIEEFGNNVALYRRLLNITSQELADRARISRDTVSRIERGDSSVGLEAVFSVLRILDLDQKVVQAVNPANTEFGRLRLADGVPKRVKK